MEQLPPQSSYCKSKLYSTAKMGGSTYVLDLGVHVTVIIKHTATTLTSGR